VNRGLTSESGANPFAHTHGAGNPLSPHYGDMLTRWRDGGHVEIATDRDTARRRAAGILTLAPKQSQ
jgi:hypothetical protein